MSITFVCAKCVSNTRKRRHECHELYTCELKNLEVLRNFRYSFTYYYIMQNNENVSKSPELLWNGSTLPEKYSVHMMKDTAGKRL